ncbi:hypothetical protein OROMI_014831 [Orobanche minor]
MQVQNGKQRRRSGNTTAKANRFDSTAGFEIRLEGRGFRIWSWFDMSDFWGFGSNGDLQLGGNSCGFGSWVRQCNSNGMGLKAIRVPISEFRVGLTAARVKKLRWGS